MNLLSCILVVALCAAYAECAPWTNYGWSSFALSLSNFSWERFCFKYDFDLFGCQSRETFFKIRDKVRDGQSVIVSYKEVNTGLYRTGFFYGNSRFINTYSNRHRLGLDNDTRVFNLDHSWSLKVRNLEIKETFSLVCARSSLTCCKQTRENQRSCSAYHPTTCRPFVKSPNQEEPDSPREVLFACPVCQTDSSNSTVYQPAMLRSSIAYNWTSCMLEEPHVSCSLYLIHLNDFIANEFDELSFTVRNHGLVGVELDTRFVTHDQVSNCTAANRVHYKKNVHSEPENEYLY